MKTVFVIAKDGARLMPTDIRHARRLMKRKEAVIYKHEPFTIRLTRESEHNVQEIEFKQDTGDKHIGVSVCSEKHEFVSAQFDPLKDETERHNDQRKYRRERRNRKRYRKPQFNNRKKPEGWFAPSVQHKADLHIQLFERYYAVCPITKATIEVGSFDAHAMQEYEQYGVVISGTDYQKGPRYGFETQKEALFYRQRYKCPLCGKDLLGETVRIHHRGYWMGDRSNRLNNLMAIHANEHTPANHQPGGKLYGIKPLTGTFSGAAFMNIVRWYIVNTLKSRYPGIDIRHTYGAETKMHRQDLGIKKSHANDAYAMGMFHPVHRSETQYFQKRRRNNRILSRFYDAKYVDIRDGKVKKGGELGCNRTNRSVPRNNECNLRPYRGKKVKAGYSSVRKGRHSLQAGDIVQHNRRRYEVKTTRFKENKKLGRYETVEFKPGSSEVHLKDVRILRRIGGWVQIQGG